MQLVDPQDFERVLSSMCTLPHPMAREAAERFLATNPGDPTTFRSVAEIETRVLDRLGEITGLAKTHGYVAGGGTEANIQAVRAARNRVDTDRPNVVVPESAHFSFKKAADVLCVELRTAKLDEEGRVDVTAVERNVDENTVLVVGVAGTTEYGRVDPIPSLTAVAEEAGCLVHVDAAWGGFVLPFTDFEWDFSHAPIDTMTIDPHKMGQAAIPAGGFLARDRETLDALVVDTPYLESTEQATLAGTRSGAGVASAYAAMETLWPDGYESQFHRSQANAEWVAGALRRRGFEVVDPVLPVLAGSIPDTVFDRLRAAGWRISRTGDGELRIVCMPHVTRAMLESFVSDLDRHR